MFLIIKLASIRDSRTYVNGAAVHSEQMVELHDELCAAEIRAAELSNDGNLYVVIATPEAERFEAGQITAVARQGYLTLKKV